MEKPATLKLVSELNEPPYKFISEGIDIRYTGAAEEGENTQDSGRYKQSVNFPNSIVYTMSGDNFPVVGEIRTLIFDDNAKDMIKEYYPDSDDTDKVVEIVEIKGHCSTLRDPYAIPCVIEVKLVKSTGGKIRRRKSKKTNRSRSRSRSRKSKKTKKSKKSKKYNRRR